MNGSSERIDTSSLLAKLGPGLFPLICGAVPNRRRTLFERSTPTAVEALFGDLISGNAELAEQWLARLQRPERSDAIARQIGNHQGTFRSPALHDIHLLGDCLDREPLMEFQCVQQRNILNRYCIQKLRLATLLINCARHTGPTDKVRELKS